MKTTFSAKFKPYLTGLAVLLSAGVSSGQLINVNFTGNTAETESLLEGPAGGLGTSWNQFNGPDSPGILVDAAGGTTTVTIDTNFGLPNTFDSPVIDLPLLRGSMTDFGKGANYKNVTIGGLSSGGTYDVWLVTLRNQPFSSGTPNGTEQYVGWWSTANTTTSPSDQLVDARGAVINTSTFAVGYNCVLFEDVVADGGGSIVFTGVAGPLLDGSNNDHRLGINGIQIQDSNPPVVGPVDDGMSTVESSPGTVLANGVSSSTITVTLKDAAGIRVPNKDVTLGNTGGSQAVTIDPLTALATNALGEVSFSVSSEAPGIEVFAATVVADGLTLTDTTTVEFTSSGLPLAFNVSFTGNQSPLPVESELVGPGGGLGTSWNQFLGPDSPGTLVDSTGTGSTVTINTNFGLSGTLDGPTPLQILRGSVTNFGKGVDNSIVTIGGLEIGVPYDIWLVTLRTQPFGSNGAEQYVGWWSTSNSTTSASDQLVDARSPTINNSTFVEGYNHVLFENVVADGGGNIVFTGVAGPLLDGSNNDHRLGLNGLQIQEATPPVVGPVDDAMSTVESSPATVSADGVSTSSVTVTLKDANGFGVPNKDVTLANTGGPQGAIIVPLTALTTNTSGEVTFSVSSNTPGLEVFTATVEADALTLTNAASVEFTAAGGPLAFNVNFHNGSGAGGLLGVVGDPGEFWNQGTTSVSNLIDATGAVVSSVSVSGLPSGGSTTTADLSVFDANRNFFGKGADATISITGLVPDTAYDLYIYALSHNTASWGDITSTERAAGDFVTSNMVSGSAVSQFLDNGILGTNGSAFVANGNYVAFQSIVSDGSGGISVLVDAYDGPDGNPSTNDGNTRLHVNGLQIRPASGMSIDYTAWRDTYYPGLGMPGDDDDNDGFSNDYERIFGMNPTDPMSSSPYSAPFEPSNGSFGYTRRSQSLANLSYKVWYSTDLEEWFEDNAAVQTSGAAINEVEVMGVSVDPALLGQSRLFVQVRAAPVTGVDLEPSLVNLWGSGSTITLLFSEPMNPSSAANPANYTVDQDGGDSLGVIGAALSSDGGSVTLTLDSVLGIDTGYTVNIGGVTSNTGQALGGVVNRQFTTWDDDPNGIKVFILAGQSNMVGFGSVEDGAGGAGTIGSLRYLADNNGSPEYGYYDFTSLLTDPGDTGSPFANRSDVKVWWRDGGANLGGTVRKGDLGPPFKGSDTAKFGPEYAFGQVLGDFFPSNNVLIIKCAWGGRDLAERFRPPSAVADRGGRVGEFYSAIIDYSRDVLGNLDTEFPEWSGQGYQIVGFGWHQGFNDRINASFSAEYKDNLPDLISDLREAFDKPDLPFVIASTGMDTGAAEASPYPSYSAVEKAQLWAAGVAQPASVLSTDTRPFWRDPSASPVPSGGQGFHWNWNAETLFLIGKSMGDDMVNLLIP